MELDILKQNTTWNDARASINNNFDKVKTALEQGGGGGGSIAVDKEMSDTSENAVSNKVIKAYVDDEAERVVEYAEGVANDAEAAAKQYTDEKIKNSGGGGGVSLPVVSSEEELESLSQNKGDLAVILSEDRVGEAATPALDLHQANSKELEVAVSRGIGLLNCQRIQGIAINTEIEVPPCPLMAGQEMQAMIASQYFSEANVKCLVLAFDAITEDGYLGAVHYVDYATYVNGELAHYDAETRKMVVNEESLAAANELIASYGDLVWVALGSNDFVAGDLQDGELKEAIRNTFAFLECLFVDVTHGVKSIRIKNDEGYSRLDSDVVKVVDYDISGSLGNLDMPVASMVRIHVPEHIEYDTKPVDFRCAITSPEVDTSVCSVVKRLEITRHSTIVPLEDPEDYSNKPPFFTLVNEDMTETVSVRWWFGADITPIAAAYTQDEGATSIPLLEEGVWLEENIAALEEIIASGVNKLFALGKYSVGSTTWADNRLSLYEKETGYIMEEYTAGEYSAILGPLITSHFTLYCNERLVPEHIDTYDRLSGRWQKNIGSDSKQDKLVSGENIATINGQSLLEGGDIVIEGGTEEVYVGDTAPTDENIKIWIDTSVEGTTGGGTSGGTITIDAEMSGTSVNAVQNKVIKKYVDDEVEDAKAYSEEMADNAEKAAKQYTDEKMAANGGGTSSSASFPIYISEPVTEDSSTWFYTANSGSYCIATYVKGRKAKEVRTPTPNNTNGWAVPMSMIELDFSKIHTGLTFPNVVWKDEAAPTFEDGAKYLVKVFNGMAEWGKYGSIRVFDFKIAGNACQALEGMTWGQYIDSKYNIYGFYWDGSTIRNPQWGSSVYIAEAPSKTTLIVEGKNYTTANGAVFPI